jgi:hypothetical protein
VLKAQKVVCLLIISVFSPHLVKAEPQVIWGKIKISDVVESLTIGGDFRLRDEYLDARGPGTNNRHRQRMRLRLSTDVQLPQNLLLGLRWATGNGGQTSTNQTFDSLSAQRVFWLDFAYLRWAPSLLRKGDFHLTLGRMPNPFWRTYSSDLIWDDDFNPEGLSQGFEWAFSGTGCKVFVNALQMVADEDSNTPRQQWLYSQQLGVESRLPGKSRLRLATAYHKWWDENRSNFGQFEIQRGNRREASGALANHFGVLELTGEWTVGLGKIPLSVQGTVARNQSARKNLDNNPRARDGYQYGFILGKAKAKKSWEVAGFIKKAQTDVTVADIADSDFGDFGGTNRQGSIFWVAFNPESWLQVKAKCLKTQVLDPVLDPFARDVNRFQLDTSVKF